MKSVKLVFLLIILGINLFGLQMVALYFLFYFDDKSYQVDISGYKTKYVC